MISNISSTLCFGAGTYLICSGSYSLYNTSQNPSQKKEWLKIALGVAAIATGIGLYTSSVPVWPEYVDFSDTKVFEAYFPNNQYAHIAANIKDFASHRTIANRGGFAFPINPEILAHAMDLGRGKTVLEIGGASGENSILMALSGAKQVYMNDIEPEEIKLFTRIREVLPYEIREKLHPLQGDCIELLTKKPEFANKFDLIFSRNLIHFLNNENTKKFLSNLKKMLKVNGRAIVTANSVYQESEFKTLLKNNPAATSFERNACFVYDKLQAKQYISHFYDRFFPCSDSKLDIVKGYEDFNLYKKELGNKWMKNITAFDQFRSSIQRKVADFFKENIDSLNALEEGKIRCLKAWSRIFTQSNFENLFKENGFEVESSFVTGADFHLLPKNADPFDHGGVQLGVVVKPLIAT